MSVAEIEILRGILAGIDQIVRLLTNIYTPKLYSDVDFTIPPERVRWTKARDVKGPGILKWTIMISNNPDVAFLIEADEERVLDWSIREYYEVLNLNEPNDYGWCAKWDDVNSIYVVITPWNWGFEEKLSVGIWNYSTSDANIAVYEVEVAIPR